MMLRRGSRGSGHRARARQLINQASLLDDIPRAIVDPLRAMLSVMARHQLQADRETRALIKRLRGASRERRVMACTPYA